MKEKDIKEYAIKNGFEDIDKNIEWNGYNVYNAVYKKNLKAGEFSCIGLPKYILVKNDTIRFANDKEVFKILDNIPDDED